ncbi:hypothetical protein MY3296_000062 [Beauveria thailandica]
MWIVLGIIAAVVGAVAYGTAMPRNFPRNIPRVPLWKHFYIVLRGASKSDVYNRLVRGLIEKHGVVAFWNEGAWTILVTKPEYLVQIFKNSDRKLNKMGLAERIPWGSGAKLFGINIIDSDGEQYVTFRKLLKEGFCLPAPLDSFRQKGRDLAEKLLKSQTSTQGHNCGVLIGPPVWRWALSVWGEYFLDAQFDNNMDYRTFNIQQILTVQNKKFMGRLKGLFPFLDNLPFKWPVTAHSDRLLHEVQSRLLRLAEDRCRSPPPPDGENKIGFSLHRAREQNLMSEYHYQCNHKQLFIAGHENVETTLNSAMEELGANPHIQELLREEVTRNIPWDYSFKDLDQLPLLNAVIYEALRLYPPLGHMSNRIATEPYVLGEDIAVPKGMMLGWHAYGIQTDPHVWGETARKFDPFRWGKDSASVKQMLRQRQARGQYLPFGIYGRKCLGFNIAMQMLQSTLCELVRNIEWKHPEGYTFAYGKDPLLVKLLAAARATPQSRIIIHDLYGLQKTYPELLADILYTRSQLESALPATFFNENGLLNGHHLYQTACTKTGYEFAVAFFAVRALGGAFVPLDAAASLERRADTLTKVNSSCILADQGSVADVEGIIHHVQSTRGKSLSIVPVSIDQPGISLDSISINQGMDLDPDGPGFVVFTSGTTGYSKGVVLRRYCFSAGPLEQGESAVVNYNASHWLGGTKNIIDGLLTCKTVFALNTPASSADVFDKFKNHHITHFVFNPALLRGIRQLLLAENGDFTPEKKKEFAKYFGGITYFLSIGGLVDQDTVDFWTEVLGCPFQNRYGSTELGGLPTLGISDIKGSLGKIAPGVEVKLSEGTRGRLFIKSPDRFLCYLGDQEKTKAAFDEEGFYKTGDIAELVGDELIFHGRERDDYIIRGNSTISAVEVERALMALGYFEEATVVAVPVSESVQLCGAIVRPKQSHRAELSISRVRSDLATKLDDAKRPVVMRILGQDEELPMTATGKPVKRQVIEDFFYEGDCGRDWFNPETPPPSVQCEGIIATA